MWKLRHICEWLGVLVVYTFVKILPWSWSAYIIAGFLKRYGLYCKSAQRRVKNNLDHVMADVSEAQKSVLIRQIWYNLGLLLVDIIKVNQIFKQPERIQIEGEEHLYGLRESGQNALFFSGHIALWEVVRIVALHRGFEMGMLYRAFNNPLIDCWVRKDMQRHGGPILHKGRQGARQLVQLLRKHHSFLLLLDQRLSSGGRAIPFMGKPAMTAPAIASLALRTNVPIMPVVVRRNGIGHFVVRFYPPLALQHSEDEQADIDNCLIQINQYLTHWVQERPQEWFWFHRRWR